jgi:hypothetical protein
MNMNMDMDNGVANAQSKWTWTRKLTFTVNIMYIHAKWAGYTDNNIGIFGTKYFHSITVHTVHTNYARDTH